MPFSLLVYTSLFLPLLPTHPPTNLPFSYPRSPLLITYSPSPSLYRLQKLPLVSGSQEDGSFQTHFGYLLICYLNRGDACKNVHMVTIKHTKKKKRLWSKIAELTHTAGVSSPCRVPFDSLHKPMSQTCPHGPHCPLERCHCSKRGS